MADSLGVGTSDEKDPENEDHKGVICSWAPARISEKAKIPATMTETLGFYENPAVKDEQMEHSGESERERGSIWQQLTFA